MEVPGLRRSSGRPRAKTIGDSRSLRDDIERLYDEKAAEALQAFDWTWDSRRLKEMNRKAAQRLLRFVKMRTLSPANYFKAVCAANRHNLFQDAFDIAIQMLRQASSPSQPATRSSRAAARAPQEWKSKTLIQAMKGLKWKKVLSLLYTAEHFTNLCTDHWDDVYLAAAQMCQEFKWPVAMALLEETVQRCGREDSHVEIPEAKVRCAVMAHWSRAFATCREIKEGDADAKASAFISTISERMDRSVSWSLSLEMISELQRQRVDSPVQSLRDAQMVCSKSSQWASVLALRGLIPEPKVECATEEFYGRYHSIKAACRLLRWQEALSMLAGLPTPFEVEMQNSEFVSKSYHQVMLACSRSSQTPKAIEVLYQGRSGDARVDRYLIKALLSILASDPKCLDALTDPCGQALDIFTELQEAQLCPGFATYQAVLDIMEWNLNPEVVPEMLGAVDGELNHLGRPEVSQKYSMEQASKKRREQRLEIEKAFLLFEAHGRDVSRWSRHVWPAKLPTRQDLSSFTSRSLLDGHCELPMKAPWFSFGRHSLRKLAEVMHEDPAWSCYAWIQYQIFVPATTRKPKGGIPPLLHSPLGRWLSCRGRSMGNRKTGTSVGKQEPMYYGPPLAVRNALLQVIAMAQRPHFGEIVEIGREDYGFIFCPELEEVLFFARRLLPDDEWTLGQKVSFAVDQKRPGQRQKAVNIAFEESIPPLLPRRSRSGPTLISDEAT